MDKDVSGVHIVYRKVCLVDPAPAICSPTSTLHSSHKFLSVAEMKLLLPLTLALGAAQADVTIDLAKAVYDEDLGQFCVMQKVHKIHTWKSYSYLFILMPNNTNKKLQPLNILTYEKLLSKHSLFANFLRESIIFCTLYILALLSGLCG